jgi:hypothetical protein
MKILILLLTLTACSPNVNKTPTENSSISKYEDDEVKCVVFHSHYAGGLSCKWKETK